MEGFDIQKQDPIEVMLLLYRQRCQRIFSFWITVHGANFDEKGTLQSLLICTLQKEWLQLLSKSSTNFLLFFKRSKLQSLNVGNGNFQVLQISLVRNAS